MRRLGRSLVLAGLPLLAGALRPGFPRESRTEPMLVIAHRGASGYAPEHTYAAWDHALALGADYLEQDLQMTADGVLVVLHDETLDRTARRDGAPCSGRVGDRTLAELNACEVGSWFNDARPEHARPEFGDERIRTLDEVLARYRDRAAFYIETKQPESAPGMEAALLELLDAHGLREPAVREWRVLIQSFSPASLRLIQQLDSGLPLVQLLERGETPRGIEARLDEIAGYAAAIGPHYSDVDAALVTAAHERCLAVHPYTVNTAAQMRRLTAEGVDGMFTDYADRLLALRPGTEPRGRAAAYAAALAHRRCRTQRTGS